MKTKLVNIAAWETFPGAHSVSIIDRDDEAAIVRVELGSDINPYQSFFRFDFACEIFTNTRTGAKIERSE